MGRIGQAIAQRAEAFKMTIGWHGPRPKDLPWRYHDSLGPVEIHFEFRTAAAR
jgi:lactate dehydrogenase-like 2-hydroxyacid dehydrogenase